MALVHIDMLDDKQQIKPFFRVFSTDLIGEKPINHALLKVKGINFNLATAICNLLCIDKKKKAGLLTDKDARDIEDLLKAPGKLPIWFFNRRKDFDTGENKHLTSVDLKFVLDLDIKRMKKVKSYKGVRHGLGLPVRGQRTRGHFRKVGKAVGVQKSKIKQAATKPKQEGKVKGKEGGKK